MDTPPPPARYANPPRHGSTNRGPRHPRSHREPPSRVPCRYFNSPTGCYRGKDCLFMHTDPVHTAAAAASILSPGPLLSPPGSVPSTSPSTSASHSANPPVAKNSDTTVHTCGICYEEPDTFGLLIECSHVFCIECIRKWRNREGKTVDTVLENMHKTCPVCRKHSEYIIPSKSFHAHGTPGKQGVKTHYLHNLSKKPCKYFTRSPHYSRWCPFGNDCHYAHQVGGRRYNFSPVELETIRARREYRNRERDARAIFGSVMMDPGFYLDELERDLFYGSIDGEEEETARHTYFDIFGPPLWTADEIYDDDYDEDEEWEEDDEEETLPELIDDDYFPLAERDDDIPVNVGDDDAIPALLSDPEEMPDLISDDDSLPDLFSDPDEDLDDPDVPQLPDLRNLVLDPWTREDWGPSHVDAANTSPQVLINSQQGNSTRNVTTISSPNFVHRVIPDFDVISRIPSPDIFPAQSYPPLTISHPDFLPRSHLPSDPVHSPRMEPTRPRSPQPRPSLRNTFGVPFAQTQRRFSQPQHTPPPGRRRPHPPRSRAADFTHSEQLAMRYPRQGPRPPPMTDELSALVDDDRSATTDGEASERERPRAGEDRGINGLHWDSRVNDLSFFDS